MASCIPNNFAWKFLFKKIGPMGPPGVPRVPILGPVHGMFSKLNLLGPIGSRGHSHTIFSNGRFQKRQSSFHIDVATTSNQMKNNTGFCSAQFCGLYLFLPCGFCNTKSNRRPQLLYQQFDFIFNFILSSDTFSEGVWDSWPSSSDQTSRERSPRIIVTHFNENQRFGLLFWSRRKQ